MRGKEGKKEEKKIQILMSHGNQIHTHRCPQSKMRTISAIKILKNNYEDTITCYKSALKHCLIKNKRSANSKMKISGWLKMNKKDEITKRRAGCSEK